MKINKLVLTCALVLFTPFTQASIIVNFAELADGINNSGGTGPTGEGGYQPLRYQWDDLIMNISGIENPAGPGNNSISYAYLDSGNAGLGVCTILDSNNQCNPSSDDNVSFEEQLNIRFNEAVRIESITINNNHDGGFTTDSRLRIETDNIFSSELDLGVVSNTFDNDGLGWLLNEIDDKNFGETFTLKYLGTSDITDRHFYLESITFSTVPTPSILSLFGLGLFGLSFFSRKKPV